MESSALIWLFWFSVLFVLYPYVFFPLLLIIFDQIRGHKETNKHSRNQCAGDLPSVSIIIAAHNEERVIGNRIQNLLEQDYPDDKMEIIVASDGSTDRTCEIAQEYAFLGVHVIDLPVRHGKSAAQNEAMKIVRGEIVVLTDADTLFEQGFVRQIILNFEKDNNGCGAGELTFKPRKSSHAETSEGFYWQYEKWLRGLEGRLGILPFASGACLAIRRDLLYPIDPRSGEDNIIPLSVVMEGYKVFYDEIATAYEKAPLNFEQQFRRRVRIAARSMRDILINLPPLFREHKYGVLWVLLSHRLIRWWSAFALPFLLISNALMWHTSIAFRATVIAQVSFYALALTAWFADSQGIQLIRGLGIPFAFCSANLAFIIATVQVLTGQVRPAYSRTT